MLADIDPGNLTLVGVLVVFSFLAGFCLVLAGVTYIDKNIRSSRGFIITAAILFALGVVLGIVGKMLGQKYCFP